MARTDRNTLSPTALAHQLEKAHRDLADRDARLRAFEALDKALGGKIVDRLARVAECMLVADIASDAIQSTAIDGAAGGHVKKFEQPTPGASTKLARRARNRFTKSLDDACTVFEQAADNAWVHTRVDDGVPRLYCLTSQCAWNRIRIPAWKDVRGRKVYAETCTACKRPLTPVEPEEQA